jgi:rubredoxin
LTQDPGRKAGVFFCQDLKEDRMPSAARSKDRRQLNVPIDKERRKGDGPDRRHCPECGGALKRSVKKLAGGSVTQVECPACGWSKASRQTDANVLMLKMTWALELKPMGGQLAAVLPPELSDALKAKAGDELVISPLTSPLGSLPMKWALGLQRKKKV